MYLFIKRLIHTSHFFVGKDAWMTFSRRFLTNTWIWHLLHLIPAASISRFIQSQKIFLVSHYWSIGEKGNEVITESHNEMWFWICKFADGLGEQRYYLQHSRSKRSDESDLEYANDSLTLVVKTSTDLKVLSPDDVAFRLNTNNISAQESMRTATEEDFLSADMKDEVLFSCIKFIIEI